MQSPDVRLVTETKLSTSLAAYQPLSTLAETVQDIVGSTVVAGANVTVSYDDTAGTITISASGGGSFDAEAARDAVGAALTGTGLISVTVNDPADTITIATSATANSSDAQLRDRATHTGTQSASTITGIATVATTGAYADLSGKPTIPTVTGTNTGDQTLALSGQTLSISGQNSVTLPTASGGKDTYYVYPEDYTSAGAFGDNTGDAGPALTAAYSAAYAIFQNNNTAGVVVKLKPGKRYRIATTTTIKSGVTLDATGAFFTNATAYQPINSSNNPAVPAATDKAAQIAGAAFTDDGTGVSNCHFIGGQFWQWRYAFVSQGGAWYHCTWQGVQFGNCNIGIFIYQGAQNHKVIDCYSFGGNAGTTYVAAATCFASGHPDAGLDNFFCDGFYYSNRGDDRDGARINATFDAWFQAAVIRPSTGSVVVDGTKTFTGVSASALSVSGRTVYIPSRNKRLIFFPTIEYGAYNGCDRGAALIGNPWNGFFQNMGGENMYSQGQEAFIRLLVTNGAATNAVATNIDTTFSTGTASYAIQVERVGGSLPTVYASNVTGTLDTANGNFISAGAGGSQIPISSVIGLQDALDAARPGAVVITETWTGADGSAWPVGWTSFGSGTVTIQGNQGSAITAASAFASAGAYRSGVNNGNLVVDWSWASGTDNNVSFMFRSAVSAGTNGYELVIGSANYYFRKYVSGVGATQLGTGSVARSSGTTYRTRLRWDGSLLRHRTWQASGTEPSTWDGTYTDSDVVGAGTISLRSQAGGGGAATTTLFDNLSVSDLDQAASGGAATYANVQVFTANGTWTKPAGVTTVEVIAVGAGGGGGAGARYATGVVSRGGQSGGAGGRSHVRFPASLTDSTVAVTVGTGGTGGTAATADSSDGNGGGSGGNSTFGTLVVVGGGQGGGPSWSGSAIPGGSGGFSGAAGNVASASGAAGTVGVSAVNGAGSGGTGGGITTGNAASAGANGGASTYLSGQSASGGSTGSSGGAGPAGVTGSGFPGGGGGGGGSSTSAAAGAGGIGGNYGGGGGGGGASRNGFASGSGGKGGDGIVIVIAE